MMHASGDDANRRLYLEDLHVGQRFASDAHTLDARQVIAFASQFDPQPFHLDDEAAKATLFGGLAASGWPHGGNHHAASGRRRGADRRGRRRGGG